MPVAAPVARIGVDRFANIFLVYADGAWDYFGNLVLSSPPAARGVAAGLSEEDLARLACTGALPPLKIEPDEDGAWPEWPGGVVIDARTYRIQIAEWWNARRGEGESLQ